MGCKVTTIICARNAAATIDRAVRSAIMQNGPVIVVDDWSSDGTAEISRRIGGNALTIVRPPEHRTLGLARRTGVEAVDTDWLMWLDADDELFPGRASRLRNIAEQRNLDAVWDAAILYDGSQGNLLHDLPMPAFMLKANSAVRLSKGTIYRDSPGRWFGPRLRIKLVTMKFCQPPTI